MGVMFTLEHIGLNTGGPGEADALAKLLCSLFNLSQSKAPKGEFAGDHFECMAPGGPGLHGHIGLGTPDLPAAMEELKAKGCAFRMETARYDETGHIKNVYLQEAIAGFAFHIKEI